MRQRLHRVAWDERLAEWKGDRDALDAAWEGRGVTGWETKLPTFSVGEKVATRRAHRRVPERHARSRAGRDGRRRRPHREHRHRPEGRGASVGRRSRPAARSASASASTAWAGSWSAWRTTAACCPVGGTFFVFSDYMRGAVRLAALSEAKCVFVWTHDSVGLGEDGPTHQPIEHLASLRAMPQLRLIRPADANETAQAWRIAVDSDGPDRADPHPPGRAGARRHRGGRGRTRGVRARRGAPPPTAARADRHRQRSLRVRRRRRDAEGRRRRDPRRLDAVVGPVRRATAGVPRRGAAAGGAAAVGRGRRRRSDGSATRTRRSASTGSARRRPATVALDKLGINPAHVVEQARALLERTPS